MIPKILIFSNENKGSSFALPAHGKGGARATSSLAAHFALQNTLSKSAEKKASPSEGEAEGDIDIEYPLYKEGIAPNFTFFFFRSIFLSLYFLITSSKWSLTLSTAL